MKIDTVTNKNFSFQRKHSVASSLEQYFAELKLDANPTEPLKNKREDPSSDNESELIERGPIATKDLKLPKNKPYQKVTENVYTRHNCGGTAFSITNISQENSDSTYDSSVYNPLETNNFQTPCSECQDLLNCDTCILQLAYSPEFIEHSLQELDKIEQIEETPVSLQETQLNITNSSPTFTSYPTSETIEFKTYPVFRKPSVRRISDDSGFQSDNPSPLSDYVSSPNPSFVLQPSKIETVTTSFRSILPKSTEIQEKEENATKTAPKMNQGKATQKNKLHSTEKSTKERLRSTLNPDIKQVKWIELVVKKNNEELFETRNSEETILHKLLQSKEKHIAESFYAIIEKMKMNPDRCSHIVAAKLSICDTIKQNKHPQLWLDYFCEAMETIQQEAGRGQTRN